MLTSSGGSLITDRGGKFAKILLTSYVNAPIKDTLSSRAWPIGCIGRVRARAKASCIQLSSA